MYRQIFDVLLSNAQIIQGVPEYLTHFVFTNWSAFIAKLIKILYVFKLPISLWWIGGGLSRIIKFMMRVSATGMLGLDLPR